jgi:hypothetical protein
VLADPQSVTINAVATSLPKVQNGPTSNVYTTVDGNISLTTKQNTTAKRFRREVRLSQKKIAEDPITNANSEIGVSVYIVIDEPRAGFSDLEIGYLIDALKNYSQFAKILGGEY